MKLKGKVTDKRKEIIEEEQRTMEKLVEEKARAEAQRTPSKSKEKSKTSQTAARFKI